MKNIVTIAILFASTCIAGSASAQSQQVIVKVPFNFSVNSETLPAGTYTITSLDGSSLIKIDSWSNSRAHVFAISQGPSAKTSPVKTVVFHKCGAHYFLSDVRGEAGSMSLHLPTSKAERRASAQTLEAGLRTSDTVLMALR